MEASLDLSSFRFQTHTLVADYNRQGMECKLTQSLKKKACLVVSLSKGVHRRVVKIKSEVETQSDLCQSSDEVSGAGITGMTEQQIR